MSDKELTGKEKLAAEEKARKLATENTEKLAAKEKKKAEDTTTYIMTRGILNWGANGKNQFAADKKPEISCKKMGGYYTDIDIWLKAGWIVKGKYTTKKK